MPEVTVNDNPAVALGSSDVPYRQLVSWDAGHNDYYAVNLADGARKKLLEKRALRRDVVAWRHVRALRSTPTTASGTRSASATA